MGQFLPIVALLVLAGLFAGLSFGATKILIPRRPTSAKVAPYECGITDQTDAPERFPVRFYLIAMIFIVFDIEIIFLYPFTIVYRSLGGFGIAAIAIFSLAVFESFVYLISNGALDWAPVRQRRRSLLMVDSNRTSRTTIRKVGLEGREPETQPMSTDGHDEEAA